MFRKGRWGPRASLFFLDLFITFCVCMSICLYLCLYTKCVPCTCRGLKKGSDRYPHRVWLLEIRTGSLEGQPVLLAYKMALSHLQPYCCWLCVCWVRMCRHTRACGGRRMSSAVGSFPPAWIPGIHLSGSCHEGCSLLTRRLIGPQFLMLAGLKSRCSQSEASLHPLESSFWGLSLILLAAH